MLPNEKLKKVFKRNFSKLHVVFYISDHLPVFVSWKFRSIKSKLPGHKTITFRSTKNVSIDNFLSDLDRVPWNTLEMFNDPNEALEQWYTQWYTRAF